MRTSKLLATVRKCGNPLIENGTATLIWQGAVAPLLQDDLHNWEDQPQRFSSAGKDLWSVTLELPEDAYVEYAFFDEQTNERMADPFNLQRIENGIGSQNQFFYMPKGKPSKYLRQERGVPRGTMTRLEVPTQELAVGQKRTVHLYRPPVDEAVPLAVVYDGTDYYRRGRLNVIVDNLIAEGKVRPFAMAFVQNGGAARTIEYSCSEATLGFLMECVFPVARERLNLTNPADDPYAVIGASLGGLMALYTGLRLPKFFCRVLSQSGAFGTPEYRFAIVDLIRYAPRPDIRVWMDAGCFEWLLEGNRKMYNLLKKREYEVKFREFSGGHNYTSWQNDIAHGLKNLFGK